LHGKEASHGPPAARGEGWVAQGRSLGLGGRGAVDGGGSDGVLREVGEEQVVVVGLVGMGVGVVVVVFGSFCSRRRRQGLAAWAEREEGVGRGRV
jgi:hypothetical protein